MRGPRFSIAGVVREHREDDLEVQWATGNAYVAIAPGGAFRYEGTLEAGESRLLSFKTDGFAERCEVRVVRDDDAPAIEVVSPEGREVDGEFVRLVVRVRDPHLARVELDGRVLRRGEGDLWESDPLELTGGARTFTLTAADRAGNRTEERLELRRRSPVLLGIQPSPGSEVDRWQELELSFHLERPVVSFTLNGAALECGPEVLVLRSSLRPPLDDVDWEIAWSAEEEGGMRHAGKLSYRVRDALPGFATVDDELGPQRLPRGIRHLTSSVELRLVEPGELEMGAPAGAARRGESPRHTVKITRPFYAGVYEVTVEQWRAFQEATGYETSSESGRIERAPIALGGTLKRPWRPDSDATWELPQPDVAGFAAPDHPVTQVSWEDARAFCAHHGFRLLSEAEWEYVCRAGGALEAAANLASPDLRQHLKLEDADSDDEHPFTAPVGSFPPNGWGFHDMLGNVQEWTLDVYSPEAYRRGAAADPRVTSSLGNLLASTAEGLSEAHVIRGGGWSTPPGRDPAARRGWDHPLRGAAMRGFRVAFDPFESAFAMEPVAAWMPEPERGREQVFACADAAGGVIAWTGVRDLAGDLVFADEPDAGAAGDTDDEAEGEPATSEPDVAPARRSRVGLDAPSLPRPRPPDAEVLPPGPSQRKNLELLREAWARALAPALGNVSQDEIESILDKVLNNVSYSHAYQHFRDAVATLIAGELELSKRLDVTPDRIDDLLQDAQRRTGNVLSAGDLGFRTLHDQIHDGSATAMAKLEALCAKELGNDYKRAVEDFARYLDDALTIPLGLEPTGSRFRSLLEESLSTRDTEEAVLAVRRTIESLVREHLGGRYDLDNWQAVDQRRGEIDELVNAALPAAAWEALADDHDFMIRDPEGFRRELKNRD